MRSFRLIFTACVALLVAACQYMPSSLKPEIRGVHPQIKSLDFQGVGLNFDVDVNNPMPVALRAPRFQYNLAFEGANFRSGAEEALKVDLPARKVGALSIPIHVNYYELWSMFGRLRGANQAAYKLDGAFLFDVAGQSLKLPVAHEGVLPIFQPPRFSVVNFDASGLSLSGGRVALTADVANPNVFDLGVRGLGYALKWGGASLGDLKLSSANDVPAGGTGRIELTGAVSALDAARQLLSGDWKGKAQLAPSGTVRTPYGDVKLPDF